MGRGRFFFDACMLSLGLYLFTVGVISQIGAGNYGRDVFLGFMIMALLGGWLIAYGIYRCFVSALKRIALKGADRSYYGNPVEENTRETR